MKKWIAQRVHHQLRASLVFNFTPPVRQTFPDYSDKAIKVCGYQRYLGRHFQITRIKLLNFFDV